MKSLLTSLGLILTLLVTAQTTNTQAAKALLHRIVPAYEHQIVFETVQSDSTGDAYELQTVGNTLHIRGNNANSMAVGLNTYLKLYCHVSISWYKDDHIILPVVMPKVHELYHKKARVQKRFFLNYCTYGYTMPWWTWQDWEWFIDWMALNGINMPLAITGQEAIWYKVWKQFGLTDLQIRSYFTGPAYLPWHRMANIDHWDGPLPQSWLDGQLELQKKIVKRERSLNMIPVLPAFAGHVPALLKTKYPAAKITSLGEWGDFDTTFQSYFLDPFDTLFNKIQHAFLKEQTRLFGTDHVYGTDPFNEVTPPSWEPNYLASAADVIYKSITASDSKAQWMQMSWIFYYMRNKWTDPRIKSFITAVPQDKMILLDYFCENTEVWKFTNSFYGQPFIWCYLGNFGGNTMIAGNLKEVEYRLENALTHAGSNMQGIGSTLEGFGVNPIMYEYVFDKVWSNGSVSVQDWVKDWSARRYGRSDLNVTAAWQLLINSAYAYKDGLGQATLTNARPSFKGHGSWTTNNEIGYQNQDLVKAWDLLLQAKQETGNSAYEFDVTNVGRQVLGNYFTKLRDQFTEAYTTKDLPVLEVKGKEMITLLFDLDSLLSTQESFLLGKWLNQARAMGVNDAEKRYYELDAKRIITTWGEKGKGLNEYANRSWAGLTATYYSARWNLFIEKVISSVKEHHDFDEKVFLKEVIDLEEYWVQDHASYVEHPKAGCMDVNRALFDKYADKIRANQ